MFSGIWSGGKNVMAAPAWTAIKQSRSIGGDVFDREFAGPTILFGVEGHLLAFAQASDSGSFKRRHMDKHVVSAAVWRDEAIALLAVEKFHCALVH
jgi:hypothetical protein